MAIYALDTAFKNIGVLTSENAMKRRSRAVILFSATPIAPSNGYPDSAATQSIALQGRKHPPYSPSEITTDPSLICEAHSLPGLKMKNSYVP